MPLPPDSCWRAPVQATLSMPTSSFVLEGRSRLWLRAMLPISYELIGDYSWFPSKNAASAAMLLFGFVLMIVALNSRPSANGIAAQDSHRGLSCCYSWCH